MNKLYPNVDIHPRKFDAADEAGVKAVVDEAISKYGRVSQSHSFPPLASFELLWNITSSKNRSTSSPLSNIIT